MHLIVESDDIVEQILIQCWLFEARSGGRGAARAHAERTLERLLQRGLPYSNESRGMRLDPYAANNVIKARAGELEDEAWASWQRTTRLNAVSLPAAPRLYRLHLRREWHAYTKTSGRPVILRLPLPLRQAQRGAARVRLLEPEQALMDVRETPGRVELRLDAAKTNGPVVAELEVAFAAGETGDLQMPANPLGAPSTAENEVWLRDGEGLIVQSEAVRSLARALSVNCSDVRDFAHAAWRWLMRELRFGDVHRSDLDLRDPLGGLLHTRRADCALGSSLLVALCRARGIPARLVTGYLLHPANLGPHSWAELEFSPHHWVPMDFGSWCYCAGDADDPVWGNFYRGRVDARFIAETAPREFTGWASAPPPDRWFRLERLRGDRIEHTLHSLPGGDLFRRDTLALDVDGSEPGNAESA